MIYSSSAAHSKAGKEHCIPNPVPQMDKSRVSIYEPAVSAATYSPRPGFMPGLLAG